MVSGRVALTGTTADEVFLCLAQHAKELGFQYCTHGLRVPIPITRPRTLYVSNYPPDWQSHYNAQRYLEIDPTVAHGMRSSEPVVWSDEFFSKAPRLWDEARQHGIRHGWAISRRDADGAFSMLVLARPEPEITSEELGTKEWLMRQLADMSHVAMKPFLPMADATPAPKLTEREVDVLRWTADGKTASEVADIMLISERTVNFHINQAVAKLQASNKINAAVKAAMNGLLW